LEVIESRIKLNLISTDRFADFGGSALGSSQFSVLPQLPPKKLLDLKVVRIVPKIIISLSLI